MDAYERFQNLLKRDFFPLLRSEGFRGSGTTFRRMNGDRFDIINIQGSRYGGQCCLNLAVHFSFLPSLGGSQSADPKKLKDTDCAFRIRLGESTEGRWWCYGSTDGETESSVASLIELYKSNGAAFFSRFEPFPEVFEKITPDEIDAGDLSQMPASYTQVFSAITMARIMKHIGKIDRCRAFADVGLRNLGKASGLKTELQTLKDAV